MKVKTIIVILLLCAAGYYLYQNSSSSMTISYIGEYRQQAEQLVHTNYWETAFGFVVFYAFLIALSFPGAWALTMFAGFLFGVPMGCLLVNIGATIGSIIPFYVARLLLGAWIQRRYATRLAVFNKSIQEHGANYLLATRFIAIFPFFLVNLFAGITKIRLTTFLWTTSVGIIPGSLAYLYAGRRLGLVSSSRDILSPQMIMAFALLALLALLPVIIKRYKK